MGIDDAPYPTTHVSGGMWRQHDAPLRSTHSYKLSHGLHTRIQEQQQRPSYQSDLIICRERNDPREAWARATERVLSDRSDWSLGGVFAPMRLPLPRAHFVDMSPSISRSSTLADISRLSIDRC